MTEFFTTALSLPWTVRVTTCAGYDHNQNAACTSCCARAFSHYDHHARSANLHTRARYFDVHGHSAPAEQQQQRLCLHAGSLSAALQSRRGRMPVESRGMHLYHAAGEPEYSPRRSSARLRPRGHLIQTWRWRRQQRALVAHPLPHCVARRVARRCVALSLTSIRCVPLPPNSRVAFLFIAHS